MDGHPAIPGVHPGGYPARIAPGQLLHHLGLLRRQGAQDHPVHPGFQHPLHRGLVPGAASHLQEPAALGGHFLHRLKVALSAVPGAVQVYQVDVGGPGLAKAPGHLAGVVPVHRLLGVVPGPQPHHAAAPQVDGGIDQHTSSPFHWAKAARMDRPTRPLFSGWNWAPATLPRATRPGTSTP